MALVITICRKVYRSYHTAVDVLKAVTSHYRQARRHTKMGIQNIYKINKLMKIITLFVS